MSELQTSSTDELLIGWWSNLDMQQRDTATDQLADVIQVAQLGRRTGILTVERGEGAAFEDGMIMFINGQITQASSGWRNGLEALSWLNTWGFCRFAFIRLPPQGSSSHHHAPPTPRIALPDTPGNGMAALAPLPATGNSREKEQQGMALSSGVIPRRTLQGNEALSLIEHIGLSRIHRHLFLLIDGQRSTAELARLIGRTQHEVSGLLDDLERSGIIQR